MFGVSRTTFHRWLKEAGPAIMTLKRGNIRLIRREDLENWLEERSQ
ncbi:helix-turn-helix domain-containing protein [Rhodovulum visakhapatnamense]|uniref:Helix-turn-helix domain-containing protein n=1 Tax=Rhodovulum visakhapatnamense TaxID=364297 RepID=A0ABS1RKX4_9RHOB|nr:helix-turn-helix domain-containing protein [Rhodovulum visakhapatnamense]MBL3569735.1 helix-turn-helix domain-containing protein [Rhodovulum visakhapatnamense]MBL3580322.1 helix-turn-helix domain-containing protein [Rhodovulum visakhapatnamense]